MSQAKITLRPPPNIDFVHGYPGIPSGPPDRPQAAVKGEVELRAGGQGVKAKWVRIELRKVETLPGGGLTNTFFDFVGNSPVLLWQSGQEYTALTTQDFPFNIRIPEAIPPSITLEKGAGVRYELIATVGIKGKKGFFRRDKDTVLAASTSIIIDKHELHTTWPVYAQPETRRISQDGVTLTVERTHTCYGPGDRITVMATTKSDSLNTVILRGFEFSLRETVVFRGGPHNTGKKAAPQTRVSITGEQKVPVNTTLYGGNQHKAELTITIPSHHTTTTLAAARHIDITYVLSVKALMGTGLPLIMDLPVIISNWPRSVSVEAVRRIGLAPNVASPQSQLARPQAPPQVATQPMSPMSPNQPSAPLHPPGGRPSFSSGHPFSATSPVDLGSNDVGAGKYNTAPNGHSAGYSKVAADEFGAIGGVSVNQAQTIAGAQAPQTSKAYTSEPTPISPTTSGATPRPRSSGRGSAPSTNRLTVANFGDDMPEEAAAQAASLAAARSSARQTSLTARNPSAGGSQPTKPSGYSSSNAWTSAEEEKRMLYERAVANVERIQGISPSSTSQTFSPVSESSSPKRVNGSAQPSRQPAAAWPTAEEEKMRLYNQAQTAALRVHGFEGGSSSAGVQRNASAGGSAPQMSAGAALYSEAMSSINRNGSAQAAPPPTRNASPPVKASTNQFSSAEQEKAALRRYHEAKTAVDRSQGTSYAAPPLSDPPPPSNAPISYDALYGPPKPSAAPATSPPPPSHADLPPSFEASSSQAPRQPNYLSEKEKLRRQYEAQDAAALAQQRSPAISAVGAPGYIQSPTPAIPQSSSSSVPSALSEKEMLRRRYEAQDAGAAPPTSTPTPPPRTRGSPANSSPRGALPTPRSPPVPPSSSSNYQPLSAAEEKARLKAKYEAETNGQQTNGLSVANPSGPSPPYQSNGAPDYAVPSALMPRQHPKQYVQQGQQGTGQLDVNGTSGDDPRLNLTPFTPFTPGFVNRAGVSSDAPPPLPPHWQAQ